jgi:hypothetical protein
MLGGEMGPAPLYNDIPNIVYEKFQIFPMVVLIGFSLVHPNSRLKEKKLRMIN